MGNLDQQIIRTMEKSFEATPILQDWVYISLQLCLQRIDELEEREKTNEKLLIQIQKELQNKKENE